MSSEPSVRVDYDLEMRSRDGVVLRCDVYRPEATEPVPAIVMRTPYNKTITARTSNYLPPLTAARAGFAVVVQDIRGRYASEGEWDLVHLFAANVDDGYDCIEWVADQPWCDGNVGMMGGSYVAVTQLAAASAKPPSLRAIAPWLLGIGKRRTLCHSLPLESLTVGWMAGLGIDLVLKKMKTGEAQPSDFAKLLEALIDPAATADVLPLRDLLNLQTPGMPEYEEVDEMLKHAVESTDGCAPQIEVPLMLCFGWYDNAGGAELFRQIRDEGATSLAREHTSMIAGPWTHNYALDFVGTFGLGALGSAIGGAVAESHLDFFGRHLRGEEADLPAVRYFVMGSNVWKQADDWPLPDTEPRELYLGSGGSANSANGDGILKWSAPTEDEPADSYDYDPVNPVPAWGFRVMYTGGRVVNGPQEQTRVEQRRDVLSYTSEPVTEPLEIVGDVVAHLFVSSSAVDTDFVVKLCVVDASGTSTNLADGFLRMSLRDGGDHPAPLEPGEVYEVAIELGPTGYRFEPGQRIRLQVTSSAFPHLVRNLNTGNPVHEDAEGVVAHQRVFHESSRASRVVLPVQPTAADLTEERISAATAILMQHPMLRDSLG